MVVEIVYWWEYSMGWEGTLMERRLLAAMVGMANYVEELNGAEVCCKMRYFCIQCTWAAMVGK